MEACNGKGKERVAEVAHGDRMERGAWGQTCPQRMRRLAIQRIGGSMFCIWE